MIFFNNDFSNNDYFSLLTIGKSLLKKKIIIRKFARCDVHTSDMTDCKSARIPSPQGQVLTKTM